MVTRRRKTPTDESFQALERGAKATDPKTHGQMNAVMASAVVEHNDAVKHVEEVNGKLRDAAKPVTPEAAKDPDTKTKNTYTAKLVLDESVRDFRLAEATAVDGRKYKVYEYDDEDEYLDYDMFDFINGLVTDCWPKPLNPIKDVRQRKFMYMGSDNYNTRPEDPVGSPENKNIVEIPAFDQHAQVSSNGNTITVYANDDFDKEGNNLGLRAFDWIRKVCELYKFKYSGPNTRKSSASHWKYSFDIHVPCVGNNYPYMVEDYFETIGLTLEDVMPADFCTQYRKRQQKDQKAGEADLGAAEVDNMVKKAITAAAQDGSVPLEDFLKQLFKDLKAAGLKFKRAEVKDAFMSAFDDDFEEDDD